MDLDTIWKGAVITGLITLNFKLVYNGMKNYKNSKNGKYNGEERKAVRYVNDCEDLHSKIENKITQIHGDVQFIKGKIEGR